MQLSQKIEIRVSKQDEAVIAQASRLLGKPLSQFVLDTSLERAHEILFDNPDIRLNTKQWGEFIDRLDNPCVDEDKIRKLMNAPTVFSQS